MSKLHVMDVEAGKSRETETMPEQTPEQKVTTSRTPEAGKFSLRSLRAETEIHAISRALEQTGWNRKRAAELLSISYRGLLYKIHQHNITPPANPQLTPLAER